MELPQGWDPSSPVWAGHPCSRGAETTVMRSRRRDGHGKGEGEEEIPAERLEQGWGGGGRRGWCSSSSQCLLIFCLAALGATAPRSWSRSTLY